MLLVLSGRLDAGLKLRGRPNAALRVLLCSREGLRLHSGNAGHATSAARHGVLLLLLLLGAVLHGAEQQQQQQRHAGTTSVPCQLSRIYIVDTAL